MEFFEDSMHLNIASEEQTIDTVEECQGMNDKEDNIMEMQDIVEPNVGVIFNTTDEAYNCYNGYAREIDFSVRILRTNKSKSKSNSSKLLQ